MKLTREEVLNFPPETYLSITALCNAVWDKFSCGIDFDTAKRIIQDYWEIANAQIRDENTRRRSCSL